MKGKIRTKIYYASFILLLIYMLISVKFVVSFYNLNVLSSEIERVYEVLLSVHVFFLLVSIILFLNSYIKVSDRSLFLSFLCLLIASKAIPHIFWWYLPGIFSLFMNYLKQKKINAAI